MEERIYLQRQNIGMEYSETCEGEFLGLSFHPEEIENLHHALGIEMLPHDGAKPGGIPNGQCRDYYLVWIDGEGIPIDWKLASLVRELNELGIPTLGSDQGCVTHEGDTMDGEPLPPELVGAYYGYITLDKGCGQNVLDLFGRGGVEIPPITDKRLGGIPGRNG